MVWCLNFGCGDDALVFGFGWFRGAVGVGGIGLWVGIRGWWCILPGAEFVGSGF